jgi:hypothetical protein
MTPRTRPRRRDVHGICLHKGTANMSQRAGKTTIAGLANAAANAGVSRPAASPRQAYPGNQALLRQHARNQAPRPETPAASFARATQGSSGPLPYRDEMERAFGQSFAAVRTWAGGEAVGPALQTLGASAAASGERVVFGAANPSRALVAHELAHIAQMRQAPAARRASVDEAEQEAAAAAARVTSGGRVALSAVPAASVLRAADTAAAAARLNGKIADAQTNLDQARLQAISFALQQAQPAIDENNTTSSDFVITLDGAQSRIAMADLQGLVTAVDTATHALLDQEKAPAAPAQGSAGQGGPPAKAPVPAGQGGPPVKAPVPAGQAGGPDVGDEIADAVTSKDGARLHDLAQVLAAALNSPAPLSVINVPFRGRVYQVDRGAISDLILKAETAQNDLLSPGAAPAPATPRPAQVMGSGPAAINALQTVINAAVEKHDQPKLLRIYNALLLARRATARADVKAQSTSAGLLRVAVDGQVFNVAQEDTDPLVDQLSLANYEAGPGSINEKATGINVEQAGVAASLPADATLNRSLLVISLATGEGAQVSISVTPTSLNIELSGVTVHLFGVQVSQLKGAIVDFTAGTIRVDATNPLLAGTVGSSVASTIAGWIQGTPFGQRGYNPMADKDLVNHLKLVGDHIKAGGGSGPAPLAAKDVTNIRGRGTISLQQSFSQVDEGGTGLVIAASVPLNIEAPVAGSVADLSAEAPKGGPPTPPPKVTSLTVETSAITIVSGGTPVARIGRLTLTAGGVSISNVDLLGVAQTAKGLEVAVRLAAIFGALVSSNSAGTNELEVSAALKNADPTAKIVPGLTRMKIEQELTEKIRAALRANPNILPGVDLSGLAGAPAK